MPFDNNGLTIVTTFFIISLLPSLFQREELYPSLVKRGEGRFSDKINSILRPLIIHRSIYFNP